MLNAAMLSRWHVHADGYVRQLRNSGKVNITCVWDENSARGQKWAIDIGAAFEADLDSLLKRPDVDAVFVDTPTTMHREVITKAAEARKHVFTEKALAPTVAECEIIAEAVKKAGIIFTISMPMRTDPIVLFAKKLIAQGEFGRISHARIRNGHGGVSGKWLPDYWFDIKATAGGALMDLGCHPMYTANFLFGKPKKVTAMLSAPFGGDWAMDENAAAIIEYEDGTTVAGETSFVSFESPGILEIYGTDATLIACGPDIKFKSKSTAKITNAFIAPTLPVQPASPIIQFVDACLLTTGGPEGFTVDDGVELTRILENCYISNRENRTVIL